METAVYIFVGGIAMKPSHGPVWRSWFVQAEYFGNVDPSELACNANWMGKTEKPRKNVRAPRIRVPNRERALFIIETQKIVGVVQRLSLTGGSVILLKGCVPHGTLAQMGLNTVFGKMTAQIQFLQTGAEGIPLAQAFRFLDMDAVSSRRFTAAVEQMQSAGFSDVAKNGQSFGTVASQTLSKLRGSIHRISEVINPARSTRAGN